MLRQKIIDTRDPPAIILQLAGTPGRSGYLRKFREIRNAKRDAQSWRKTMLNS